MKSSSTPAESGGKHGVITEPVPTFAEQLERGVPLWQATRRTHEEISQDTDLVDGMASRVQAAVESFTEAQWAALGRRMLGAQLATDGAGYQGSLTIDTTDAIADISGISQRRLWLGEES